jgi:hypothetical protein
MNSSAMFWAMLTRFIFFAYTGKFRYMFKSKVDFKYRRVIVKFFLFFKKFRWKYSFRYK